MSYRPPVSSKWAPAEPFRKSHSQSQSHISKPDEDGWQTVGRVTASTKTWSESALKKPKPQPQSMEEAFPALKESPVAPAVPAAPDTAPKTLTFAERMKIKLAEEAAQKKAEEDRKAEEEDRKAEVPLCSILKTSIVAKQFQSYDYAEPVYEEDMHYYSEYPEHYDEDRAPPIDYHNAEEYEYENY